MPFTHSLEGVKESGGANFAPAGVYLLRVEETTEKKSRNGDPLVGMKLYIDSGVSKGVWMFHNITFLAPSAKGAGFSKHFLRVIGQPFEGNVTVDPAKWVGKVFKGRIEIKLTEKDGQVYQNNNLTNDSWLKDDKDAPELGLSAVTPEVTLPAGPVAEKALEDVPF